MLIRLLVLLPLIAGLARAQAPPPSAELEDVVGCYRLEYAEWTASREHLPDPGAIPERSELTDEPFTVGVGRPDGTVERIPAPGLEHAYAVRYPGLPDGAGPFEYWKLAEGELWAGRYLPTAGFWLRMRRSEGGWAGELIGSVDYPPPDGRDRASVRARLWAEGCPEG